MIEKALTLATIIGGTVGLAICVPELLYYAPPIHVAMFGVSLVLVMAGIRSIVRN